MMVGAALIAIAWLGFVVLAGYLFAQLVVLALEILTKVTEELR